MKNPNYGFFLCIFQNFFCIFALQGWKRAVASWLYFILIFFCISEFVHTPILRYYSQYSVKRFIFHSTLLNMSLFFKVLHHFTYHIVNKISFEIIAINLLIHSHWLFWNMHVFSYIPWQIRQMSPILCCSSSWDTTNVFLPSSL